MSLSVTSLGIYKADNHRVVCQHYVHSLSLLKADCDANIIMSSHYALLTGALFASILLTSSLSPLIFYRKTRSFRKRGECYRNEDGIATSTVQLAFDRESGIYILGLLLCSAFGLLINISAAILLHTTSDSVSNRQGLLPVALKAVAAVSRISSTNFND